MQQMYLTLNEIKGHLNLDSSFTDDDAYLTSLYYVAEDAVKKHIDVSDFESFEDEDGNIKVGLRQAFLLLIGHFYENREATTSISKGQVTNIPLSYDYLLDLYQTY